MCRLLLFSSMLKRLEESGFVECFKCRRYCACRTGPPAVPQLIRRHRLLEVFLVQVMGYTWNQVDAEAHRMEHAISAAFEEKIDHLCGYPTHCPHGDPIPRKDGALPEEKMVALVALTPGRTRGVAPLSVSTMRGGAALSEPAGLASWVRSAAD